MDFSDQQIKTLKTVVGQVVDDKLRINNDLLMQEMRTLEHRIDAKAEKNKHEIIEFIDDKVLS